MSLIKSSFANGLFAITLFVDDLELSKDFYGAKLQLDLINSDGDSALYQAGTTYINLLRIDVADALVPEEKLKSATAYKAVYTIPVLAVDEVARALEEAGVEKLNGPIDRPWGVRTVSFADPSGHVWEFADHLKSND